MVRNYRINFLLFLLANETEGRRKAVHLESKCGSMQKSRGIRIAADGIAMLQLQKKTSITITDLVHSDGGPAGAEILIKIPLIYD